MKISVEDCSLIIRSSEQPQSTLFCYTKNGRITCELYRGLLGERVDTGYLRFTLKGEIDERKVAGFELISEDSRGAIFKIPPLRVEIVDSMVFEDAALIYSKFLVGILDIRVNPSESQIHKYGYLG